MNSKEFKKLCKENDVELKDLPAFPPKTFLDFANDKVKYDEQWRKMIVMIGNTKRRGQDKTP